MGSPPVAPPGTAPSGLVERGDVEWRRRIMVFGESIRSDFDNPLATTWRALMRSLTRTGHEVVFIEPRRSDSLAALLRHRGSAPLRQFSEAYPDIQYRTLDLPRGRELSMWLARELALIDCVVVLHNATDEVKALIAEYDEPRLVRVQPIETGEFTIGTGESMSLGPAIDPVRSPRQGVADRATPNVSVLAWDAELASLATQAWHQVVADYPAANRFSLGSLSLDGWEPITELDVSSALAGTDVAVVVAGLHPAGPALAVRSLLPWSFGVRSVTVVGDHHELPTMLPVATATVDELTRSVIELTHTDWPDLSRWSADTQASALIAAINGSRASLLADQA